RRNAALNSISNVEFFTGSAEQILPDFYARESERAAKRLTADVIVVDPPRKGCAAPLLATMVKMQPARIVYVSCDSATLARDLKYLTGNGYEVRKVQGVDMFGGTGHVETVVQLFRKTPDTYIDLKINTSELDLTSPEAKGTYQEIKDYILGKHDVKP
ncbi:MAG: 23S rRNA (uracil(1939)-C(5))-methyltransferase RlmD, partial [Butyrivibrio sp.]|nr:23S rRNA (uracil(1939)-C(5))-methyltransferase RlmD [Butyrivibrio sp.]